MIETPTDALLRIDPSAVYDLAALEPLACRKTLTRQLRSGRLRGTMATGRWLVTGQAVLDWLDGRGHQPQADPSQN